MSKSTLYYLIGLPGSGKSTFAKAFAEQEETNTKVLSSDSIRAEMFGSEEVQDDPSKVFDALFKKAKELLAQGYNVMVDATNVNRKKRINALKQFPNVHKVALYIATPIGRCIINDAKRERTVGTEVITRMYEQMQVPAKFEGWDMIQIVNVYPVIQRRSNDIEFLNDAVKTNRDKQAIMKLLSDNFTCFQNIYNLPQDSRYHSLSVSRHTYYVYEYLHENYRGEDRLAMLWAGLLHDTGKFQTKRYKPGARYANFFAHENVSAQHACLVLQELGFGEDFVLEVMEICQLHMELLNIDGDDENALNKKCLTWGPRLYDNLFLFHEADTNAK
jgi:putative nucleotidyltransferase with HDIG domain